MLNRLERWLRRRSDYKAIFTDTESGQRVLEDMSRLYHFVGPVTVAGDPISSAYRDGQRSVVIEIMRTLAMTDAEIRRVVANAKRAEQEQAE